MADDRTMTGKADRIRINLNEDYEVRYWTEKWGVSREAFGCRACSRRDGKGRGKEAWQGELNSRTAAHLRRCLASGPFLYFLWRETMPPGDKFHPYGQAEATSRTYRRGLRTSRCGRERGRTARAWATAWSTKRPAAGRRAAAHAANGPVPRLVAAQGRQARRRRCGESVQPARGRPSAKKGSGCDQKTQSGPQRLRNELRAAEAM